MIRLEDVTLSYGDEAVLEGLDLRIAAGERVALMGPSGCGKSSLLQLVAGLVIPEAGTVTVNADRIAYAFQEPRLLPDRTAAQNVNAVLGDRRSTLPEAARWLAAVGLDYAAYKYPAELSGGMAQRVNLARALAYNGELLLLDEPFKGLDEERRIALTKLIRDHVRDRTLLLATHDRTEAEALCGRICVYENRTFR